VRGLAFDFAHLLAGGLVLISFMLLYQTRLYALLNVFAAQAVVLSMSVAWQAYVQSANHLYVTAMIAFAFKAVIIPVALHRIIAELGIRRDVENVVGVGLTMLAGLALVALSEVVMLRIASEADALAREDLAFALSVVLLGLLMMVVRRNAVSMVVGFMSLENGLILAATGAKGMPLVVEISVAFSVLVALVVIGVFLFRISERFETVDAHALDRFRGDRRLRPERTPLSSSWRFQSQPRRHSLRSSLIVCRLRLMWRRPSSSSLHPSPCSPPRRRPEPTFWSTTSTSCSSCSIPSSGSPPASSAQPTSRTRSRPGGSRRRICASITRCTSFCCSR
jgi:hydrogenase-4 component E